MKDVFKFIGVAALLGLTACAGPQKPAAPMAVPAGQAAPPAPSGPPRHLVIFIPKTDEAIGSWLKLFEKYPQLRMAVAVSPRFQRFIKEPLLKEQALGLVKAGRLELVLQLPNAPFLPLLINTDSARSALPPGSPLPNPPFARPEDATQIVAKAKAEFYRMWGMNPKGIVVPQGAVNAELLTLLNRLGFGWVVGALGAPSVDGGYRYGSLLTWDATPLQEHPHFTVQVWDERISGNPTQSIQTLSSWAQTIVKKNLLPILPSDSGLPAQDLPRDTSWGGRTWSTKDWSPWIGSPHKNAAWSWLRITREALDSFKNSGQASVRRLDMAFEEIYNAENANYFSGITEGESTFTLADEREREFKATLSSVYRLIGQAPPEDLFSLENTSGLTGFKASSTTVTWETLPDGRGHLVIEDIPGDDHGDGQLLDPPKALPGMYDLRRIEVWASADNLDWAITLGAAPGSKLGNFETAGPLIDLYLDLNGQPNVGTTSLLPGRGPSVAAADAWEYAFVLWGTQAQFYRTRGAEGYELSETIPLRIESNQIRFSIPRTWLRGNPQRWGYQALVMPYDQKSMDNDARPLILPEVMVARRLPIYDLVDPLDIPQADLLTQVEQNRRNDISFVRYGTK